MLPMAASMDCNAHDAGPEASAQAPLTQGGSQQPIRVAGVPGTDLPRPVCVSSLECSSQAKLARATSAAAVKAPNPREGLPTVQAPHAFPPAGQVSAAGADTAAGQPLDVSAARQAGQGSLPAHSQAGAARAAPAHPVHAAQGAAAEPAGTGKAAELQAGQHEGAAPPTGQADSANGFDAAARCAQHTRAASAGTAASPAPAGTEMSPPASEGEAAEPSTRQDPTGSAAAEAAASAAEGLLRPAERPAEDDGGAEAPAQRQVVEPLAALASPADVAAPEPLLQAGGTGQAAPACRSQLESQAPAAAGAGLSLAGGGTTNVAESGPLLTSQVQQAADAHATSFVLVPPTSKPAAQAQSPLTMPTRHPQSEPLLVRQHLLHDLSCTICLVQSVATWCASPHIWPLPSLL